MGLVRESVVVRLGPERAWGLWTDLRRWPTFIEGFARVERLDGEWPDPGTKLVWQSTPDGRGTVTERVTASVPGQAHVTEVFEERLAGSQAVRFEPEGDGGALVELELDYALAQGGPLAGITDVLFIRRALRDAAVRTLRRFATEAAEEAAL